MLQFFKNKYQYLLINRERLLTPADSETSYNSDMAKTKDYSDYKAEIKESFEDDVLNVNKSQKYETRILVMKAFCTLMTCRRCRMESPI